MNSVLLNGFSLEILDDTGVVEKAIYRNSNYYALADRTEYKLRLGNDHGVKTDAHVWIDNEKVGVWRINPYSRVTIERPANVSRKFVLLKEGTSAAREAGIGQQDSNNGLVKVVFKPEKISAYIPLEDRSDIYYQNQSLNFDPTNADANYFCTSYTDTVTPYGKAHRQCSLTDEGYSRYVESNLSPAGTGLGANSDQRFRKVGTLDDIDLANVTTIYARLVVDDDITSERRKYMPLSEVRSINKSTPIPLPINLPHPSRPQVWNYFDKF